jgi:hypothetical protein
MPDIARPGAVRPALPPRFAPGKPAEMFAEAFPFEQGSEHAAVESEKLTIRQKRRENASPLPTPQAQAGDGEQPSASALSPAISPIVTTHAAGQPESPARVTIHPPAPAVPAPVVQGQSVYRPEQGPNLREHPDAPAVLSVIPTVTASGNVRPPLLQPVIQERATNPVRVAATEIHVTIDRIDVRAPAAAANATPQPAPRPRPSSTLSLSDYLRQRGGGAR